MAHVTFVHGIANKPPPEVLLGMWERSLAEDDGVDLATLGVTSSMVYWADVLYPDHASGEFESIESGEGDMVDLDLAWRDAAAGRERAWLDGFAAGLGVDGPDGDAVAADGAEPPADLERVPLPSWLKVRLMKVLLRDVHHYLFNAEHLPRPDAVYRVRDEIRGRMVVALAAGAAAPGPHIVVSHSMGTVIAYDCLKRVPECPAVDGLITLGSPLGRHEIPDEMRPDWNRDHGFPSEGLQGPWLNVFDRLDPVVGVYPHLRYHYRRGGQEEVVDINEQNWGKWRHDIAKYLHGRRLRESLAEMLRI